MRWRLLAGVLLLGVAVGVAGAADGPLADAGLDQSVIQGATVYLDAGGSTAPDGEITDHEWTIERPNGTETAPACSSCARTEFVAEQPGTYAVTVEVTDDQGRTDQDTLYVEVAAREMPEAKLSGPKTLTVGEPGTFTLTGTAGDAPLSSYTWSIDGESRDPDPWVPAPATTITFKAPGEYTISATVTDTAGYDSRVKHTVTVDPSDTDEETASGSGGRQSEGSAGSLGTTYDRMFVDDDGDVYIAIGNEIGERDEFSMYLPNGRELRLSTEQISQEPGSMFDDPSVVHKHSYLEFERTVADLKYFSDQIKKKGYTIEELKDLMPQTECRLSDQSAQRCVEQEMKLLTREGQEKHGQLFTNIGQSWNKTEFGGHPKLGPDETRAPHVRGDVEENSDKTNDKQIDINAPTNVDSGENSDTEGDSGSGSMQNPVPPGAEKYTAPSPTHGNDLDPSDNTHNRSTSSNSAEEDTQDKGTEPSSQRSDDLRIV